MSEAMNLLNSLNLEDYIDPSITNDILTIDANGRITNVPNSEIIFGVEGECDVERKYFKAPRIVGDNIDLSTMLLRINFKNALGEKDMYIVDDLAIDGDYITFSWLLNGKVLASKGVVMFTVSSIKVDVEGVLHKNWSTTLAAGKVLEGLTMDDVYDYGEFSAFEETINDLATLIGGDA